MDYVGDSTILLSSYENNRVWDMMLLMDDELFNFEFSHLYSKHFVIDDHAHNPPVFLRVKNYNWLKDDFSKRLSVALWIFQNSLVIQEKDGAFSRILSEGNTDFRNNLPSIIRRKYLEMRGERHNLRYSAPRTGDIANVIVKGNIAKLCFELILLAEGKPHPFRILLPQYARKNSRNGEILFSLAQKFLAETDPGETILLSDEIIGCVANALRPMKLFERDFLDKWWLYMD